MTKEYNHIAEEQLKARESAFSARMDKQIAAYNKMLPIYAQVKELLTKFADKDVNKRIETACKPLQANDVHIYLDTTYSQKCIKIYVWDTDVQSKELLLPLIANTCGRLDLDKTLEVVNNHETHYKAAIKAWQNDKKNYRKALKAANKLAALADEYRNTFGYELRKEFYTATYGLQ